MRPSTAFMMSSCRGMAIAFLAARRSAWAVDEVYPGLVLLTDCQHGLANHAGIWQ